jgi:hypothetical protein
MNQRAQITLAATLLSLALSTGGCSNDPPEPDAAVQPDAFVEPDTFVEPDAFAPDAFLVPVDAPFDAGPPDAAGPPCATEGETRRTICECHRVGYYEHAERTETCIAGSWRETVPCTEEDPLWCLPGARQPYSRACGYGTIICGTDCRWGSGTIIEWEVEPGECDPSLPGPYCDNPYCRCSADCRCIC